MIFKKVKKGQQFLYNNSIVWVVHQKSASDVVIKLIEHPWDETDIIIVNIDDLKEIKAVKTVIKQKPIKAEKKVDIREKNVFFASQMLTMPNNCENCNKTLNAKSNFAKRCVTAHILPKSTFKSVATNPKNIMFLGVGILGICQCHDTWDMLDAETRLKMKCYDIAIKRFEEFKHLLTPHEYNRALTYLGITKK
jgi:hypothetical protein